MVDAHVSNEFSELKNDPDCVLVQYLRRKSADGEVFVLDAEMVKGTTDASSGKDTGNLFILKTIMLNILESDDVKMTSLDSGDIEVKFDLKLKCKELKRDGALCFAGMELSDMEVSAEEGEL